MARHSWRIDEVSTSHTGGVLRLSFVASWGVARSGWPQAATAGGAWLPWPLRLRPRPIGRDLRLHGRGCRAPPSVASPLAPRPRFGAFFRLLVTTTPETSIAFLTAIGGFYRKPPLAPRYLFYCSDPNKHHQWATARSWRFLPRALWALAPARPRLAPFGGAPVPCVSVFLFPWTSAAPTAAINLSENPFSRRKKLVTPRPSSSIGQVTWWTLPSC